MNNALEPYDRAFPIDFFLPASFQKVMYKDLLVYNISDIQYSWKFRTHFSLSQNIGNHEKEAERRLEDRLSWL